MTAVLPEDIKPTVLYRVVADTGTDMWHGRWTANRAKAERQALNWQHEHDFPEVWLEKAAGTRHICAVLHELSDT